MKKIPFKRSLLSLVAGIGLAAGVATTQAHHPIHGKFDPEQEITLNGVVTNVDWSNPHTHVFLNVTDGDEVVNWAIELESPIILKASGWADDTLVPGDHIEVSGIVARNGTRQVWGEDVISTASGRHVFIVRDSAPVPSLAKRPAPRWPDGQIALGTTGDTADGYWGYPSEKFLMEDGVSVDVDQYGQLANLRRDASKVAPFQDWALGLFRYRQQRFLQDDPTFRDCKPYAGPRQYQSDLGIKILEDRPGERIFILMGSGNHNYRIIYLDGRDPVGQAGGDDDNPLFFGRSVGHWEGDTLVVTTDSFNENFWFSNGGLPHTSLLTMHERFSRPDLDTLHYEVTIEDPGAYTRNWTASWDLRWVGGEELPVHFCQDNRP